MRQYIIRRVLISIGVLFGVSILLYALVRSMPGDYIQTTFAGNPNVTEAMIQNLRKLYGLDTGIVEGYFQWLGKALRGDLGISFVYGRPVTEVITDKMWVSFFLALPAFILQLLLAVPMGITSASKQYSKSDYAVTVFAMVGISLPSFFFAALLQRIFSMGLGWLPLQGMTTAREDYTGIRHILDMAVHYILPVTVLTVTGMGSFMRYTRTNMLEVLQADYIRTARAKGLKKKTVIYRHGFRNTLIPLVTIIGGSLPGLFSGALITETLFSIPGIGYVSYQSMVAGDIPFSMFYLSFMAVLTLASNLLTDILYGVVDPRVRIS